MNFDNGHRQRQGQHNNNNKRGRSRNNNNNNRRPGGGQFNGGGNSINRVYESNGPDVKVRGTAQTIAEKYMQLGRDAQASGDNVMAESYFQFSEHYFRVMAAAQPLGQPAQQLRRPEDDEFDDETGEAGDGGSASHRDGNRDFAEGETQQLHEGSEPGAEAGERPLQDGERQDSRNYRGRERFRPRWPNRRVSYGHDEQGRDISAEPNNGTQDAVATDYGTVEPQSANVEANPQAEAEPRRPVSRHSDSRGQDGQNSEATSETWEAPSFLMRPTSLAPAEPADVTEQPVAEAAAPVERRPRTRRVKVAEPVAERLTDTESSSGE